MRDLFKENLGKGLTKTNESITSRTTPAIIPQTREIADFRIKPKAIETRASKEKILSLKKNSLLNLSSFWNLTIEGLINPRKKGTKLIKIRISLDCGDLKKNAVGEANKSISKEIRIPLKIDVTQAVFKYFLIFFFSWIKKAFIPVSVVISKKASTNEAIPNNPNSVGDRIRARIKIFKKAIRRVIARSKPIQKIPFSVSLKYFTGYLF